MEPLFSGRYRFGEELGSGVSGEVLVATDADGREFACRRLRVDLSRPDEAAGRFRREQSILIGLTNENLVTLHDVVPDNETTLLVLDLVHGGSLRQRLTASGTLLPKEIARIAAGIATALHVIHEAGVVHGDVRPENVLMDDSGAVRVPKLTDAGLFLVTPKPGPRQTSLLTTSKYTAPEVAAGAEPTPAADLYALGITIYELYCGIPPFPGGYIRRDDEEPGRPGDLPEPLWEVIRVLLAVDPAVRPQAEHIAAVLHAIVPDLQNSAVGPRLERPPRPTRPGERRKNTGAMPPPGIGDTLYGDPFTSPPPAPRRKRKLVPILAVVTLAVAGGITALSIGSSSTTSSPPPGITAGTPPAPRATSSPDVSQTSPTPTIAPNLIGKKLADAQDTLGNGIQVEIINSIEQTAAPGTVIDQDPKAGSALNGRIKLTVAQPAVEAYLSEMKPVNNGFWSNVTQPGAIAGKTYPHTVSREVSDCPDTGSVEYNVSKGYRKLVAFAGMDDNSGNADLKVQVEIFGDGRKLQSAILELGKMTPIDADLSGVLRLKISWQVVNPNCRGSNSNNTFDLGEAKLLGLPGEVPASTATTTN